MEKSNDSLILHPIGIIRTPHKSQGGIPIQPAFARDSEGVIEIFPQFREGLADLKGFERIWTLFWCHQAKPYKLKVVPYRDVVLRGLFSTRAPSRPNPVGISVLRLVEVDESTGKIKVAGVDMLDRTPIIDIKPYVPKFDSHPDSEAGWLDRVRNPKEKADDRFSDKNPNPEDSE